MATGNLFKSDLYNVHNIIQTSMMSYPKELIISTLRDYFSKDSYYHYESDEWGFPKTVDHTNLNLGAGMHDNSTVRVYIGENYRYDGIYYPAILVKHGGIRYVPISFNRNKGTIKYSNILYQDGYGNEQLVKRPESFVTAGAWEGSIMIDVMTRSLRSRDDLIELVSLCCTEIYFDDVFRAGIVMKPLNVGAPTEIDDRNDKLFKQTVTIDIRAEWRREIPVKNIIEAIFFTVDFADIKNNGIVAPNLTVNSYDSIYDAIYSI